MQTTNWMACRVAPALGKSSDYGFSEQTLGPSASLFGLGHSHSVVQRDLKAIIRSLTTG